MLANTEWYQKKKPDPNPTTTKDSRHAGWESPAKVSNATTIRHKKVKINSKGEIHDDNDSLKPCAVLFVRRTPGGKLINLLRKDEEALQQTTGTKIKLVERAGVSLKTQLWKSDPWNNLQCVDLNCRVCSQDQKQQICHVRNLVYQNTCLICKEAGRLTCYIGESSRCLKLRGLEHYQDLEKRPEMSHMSKHQEEAHPGSEVRHQFSVVKSCTNPFDRQIKEFVRIRKIRQQGGKVINIKK